MYANAPKAALRLIDIIKKFEKIYMYRADPIIEN